MRNCLGINPACRVLAPVSRHLCCCLFQKRSTLFGELANNEYPVALLSTAAEYTGLLERASCSEPNSPILAELIVQWSAQKTWKNLELVKGFNQWSPVSGVGHTQAVWVSGVVWSPNWEDYSFNYVCCCGDKFWQSLHIIGWKDLLTNLTILEVTFSTMELEVLCSILALLWTIRIFPRSFFSENL